MSQEEKTKKRLKQALIIGIVCIVSILIAVIMSIIGNQKIEKEWDKAMSDDRESYFSEKINDIVNDPDKSACQKNKELQELKEQRYDEYHVGEEYYIQLTSDDKENISRILDNNFKGWDSNFFTLYDVLVINLKPDDYLVKDYVNTLLSCNETVKELDNAKIAEGYIIIISDNHQKLWVESTDTGIGYVIYFDTDNIPRKPGEIEPLDTKQIILSEDEVQDMIENQQHGLLAVWTAEVLADELSGISYYYHGNMKGLDDKRHKTNITFCATPMLKKLFEFAKEHTVSEDGAGELYEQFSILYKLDVMSENLISDELPLLMGY